MSALKKTKGTKCVELLTKTFVQELKSQGCCNKDIIKAASILLEQAIEISKEDKSSYLQVLPRS